MWIFLFSLKILRRNERTAGYNLFIAHAERLTAVLLYDSMGSINSR